MLFRSGRMQPEEQVFALVVFHKGGHCIGQHSFHFGLCLALQQLSISLEDFSKAWVRLNEFVDVARSVHATHTFQVEASTSASRGTRTGSSVLWAAVEQSERVVMAGLEFYLGIVSKF